MSPETDEERFGSSAFGGRPTFALAQRENDDKKVLCLYELMPAEQAEGHESRMKRWGHAVDARPIETALDDVGWPDSTQDLFEDDDGADEIFTKWRWSDWVAVKVERISNGQIQSVSEMLRQVLEAGPYSQKDFIGQDAPGFVLLPEDLGIRLALTFVGIKPIRRVDKQRELVERILDMSREECLYWRSLCRSPSDPNGAKALRTLLTDHL